MIPNPTYDGSVEIAGITLKCYTLDDGRRIIDMEGVKRLLKWIHASGELSLEDSHKLIEVKEGRTVMERVTPTAFPATKTVHWPSGPVNACDRHTMKIVALGNVLGTHVAVTAAPEGATCKNCENERPGGEKDV